MRRLTIVVPILLIMLQGCAWVGDAFSWLSSLHHDRNFAQSAKISPKLEVTDASPAGPSEAPPTAGAAYEQGKTLLADGRPALAVKYFRIAMDNDPHNVSVLNGLAIAYAESGRDDLSLKYFEKALDLAPDHVATLNNIGFAALRWQEFSFARKYLADAKRLQPGHATISANLAMLAAEEAMTGVKQASTGKSTGVEVAAADIAPLIDVIRLDAYRQRIDTRRLSAAQSEAHEAKPCETVRKWLNYDPFLGATCTEKLTSID